MRRVVTSIALALAVGIPTAGLEAQDRRALPLGASVETLEEVENSWIFVFRSDVPAAEVRGRAGAIASQAGGRIVHVYTSSIKGFSAKMPSAAAARVAAQNPNIAYYEPDGVAFGFPPNNPNKPDKGKGGNGGGEETSSCTTQNFGAEEPWGVIRVGGYSTYVGNNRAWVIDSGIDMDHADLNVDVDSSRTFVSTGKDANSPDDLNGHGTHVAGTIAAIAGNDGVVGVAAGAPVVAVKVLDRRGSGSYSGVIAGVDYVAENGVEGDVANMSLGGGKSQALNDAVIAASTDVMFAVAAGNSGADSNNYSPASANGPNIYTISAVNRSDVMASWSNYGNPPVDYAAPGVSILSTWKNCGYNTISGTSMATPHAAGVLLVVGSSPSSDGIASGDPDGNPDPIIHK